MNKRNGLALLAALMLMAILVGLAVSLASLALLEQRQAQAAQQGALLRLAAEQAARRGFVELQAGLGPDIAHTYESTSGRLAAGGRSDWVRLTGGDAAGSAAMSWSVADLSMGYDVAAGSVAAGQASRWARTSAGRAKLPQALAAEVTPAQSLALAVGGRAFFEASPRPGTTWQVRGLLTDPVRGGWRQDLADGEVLAAEVGRPIAEVLRAPSFGQIPAKGYPLARVSTGVRSLETLPVLADFRLSMGFFNARSDGRHRLRFHGSAVFWNRLSVPVLAGPQGKLFLVEVIGAPEVTVTNLETHSTFTADLDDCPQEDFGIVRQGRRERGLWFWAEIADAANAGMTARGLLPGEVYALVNPSPASQPQGLARILTRMTWKMERGRHGPGWKRPEPTVFLPTDRIEIAVRFRGKVGIRLRPYAGEPDRDVAIADYPAAPVVALEDVSLPDFLIRTTGEDYSREDSAGYVIEERRACLRVRLRPREASALWSAAEAGRFSRSRWDFSRPADAAEWIVDHPVLSALHVVDQDASPLAGPLWDQHVNRHDATEVGAFASVRLRDFPGWPTLSVGSLRHLGVSSSALEPETLDRLFSSAPLHTPEPGVVSHNPFLVASGVAAEASGEGSARALQIIGPFNVNSRDTKAWEAFLLGASGAWRPDAGGPFEPQTLDGPLFFTRPHGATLAKGGASSPVDIKDTLAVKEPEPALSGLSGQQGVRWVEPDALARLARKIVDLQPRHGWPFPSLEAFTRSRLLARALEESGVNRTYAGVAWELPIQLKAEDLLEAWSPVLTVRGDSFKVTGQAIGSGGSLVCEMVVQRVAEEHLVAHLGRRFRIISVRFRNP